MDYYLKFNDEAAMKAAFGTVETDTPFGMDAVHPLVQRMAVDIVGALYEDTGKKQTVEFNGDKLTVPVMAPLEGWHVNLRGDALPQELEQYRVEPKNPRRVWA